MKQVARDSLSENDRELLDRARAASENAYAPYSRFHVGAAVLARGAGQAPEIIAGCNVENVSYGLTLCAERAALAAAVCQGRDDFDAVAIYTPTETPTPPCGACRQFLHELAPGLRILIECETGVFEADLASLLPYAFGSESDA